MARHTVGRDGAARTPLLWVDGTDQDLTWKAEASGFVPLWLDLKTGAFPSPIAFPQLVTALVSQTWRQLNSKDTDGPILCAPGGRRVLSASDVIDRLALSEPAHARRLRGLMWVSHQSDLPAFMNANGSYRDWIWACSICHHCWNWDRPFILLVRVPHHITGPEQSAFEDAVLALSDAGAFPVWIVADQDVDFSRVPRVVLQNETGTSRPATDPPKQPRTTPVSGQPHAASLVEKRVEAALKRWDWAWGRAWNQSMVVGPYARQICVDLIWKAERVVVEFDGREHRHADSHQADRERDRLLQLDGYKVFRFTNQDVDNDLEMVCTQMELGVCGARRGAQEG